MQGSVKKRLLTTVDVAQRAEQSAAMNRRICCGVLSGFQNQTAPGFGPFFPESIEVSDDAKDLISKLLCSNPLDRPTATEALKHHWFNDEHDSDKGSTSDHSLSSV